MILNPITNKFVHFGSLIYQDFTKHQNKERQKNYIIRASNIKGDWRSDKFSPNNLSLYLLWNYNHNINYKLKWKDGKRWYLGILSVNYDGMTEISKLF